MKIIYVNCGWRREYESDLRRMITTWAVMKIRPEKKFRPVRDLNPWPLQYQCSALPVELASQLEAGHYVGSEKPVKR